MLFRSSLRRLEIFYDYDYDDNWEDAWDTKWAPVWGPTEEVTSWSFPSLKSLIVHCFIPIQFSTPRLTCFKFWDSESSNTAKLLSFLNNCPLLEHIYISYSTGRNKGNHDLVVSLPNLHTYTQTTHNGMCPLTVFNRLSLPSFCSITLRFQICNRKATETDVLPRFKNPDYLSEIKQVKLKTTYDANIYI